MSAIDPWLQGIIKKHKRKRKRDDRFAPSVNGSAKETTGSIRQQLKDPKPFHRSTSPSDSHAILPAYPSVPVRSSISSRHRQSLNFEHRYILAPMVGASELAFRLLCRKYGAQLAYTPMMDAHRFAHDVAYRKTEFQTTHHDRPLVCHFSANRPDDFVQAIQAAAPYCDAVDLNLGCPQRTAFVGHFGSYLLDRQDRELICNMVRAGAQASSLPIFCKIRLLDTLPETIELCQQLQDAGVLLIAVHARYRASWERQGPGARDGPAMLDQVKEIKKVMKIPIIANGNTITYDDVCQNLDFTEADGIMCAEGILDNPAIFLQRLGSREDDGDRKIDIPVTDDRTTKYNKKRDKLLKKLDKIGRIEQKQQRGEPLSSKESTKLGAKQTLVDALQSLDSSLSKQQTSVSLRELYDSSHDKIRLALEYLQLALQYPVPMRTVIFHTRRMLKAELTEYQLLSDCLACDTTEAVMQVLHKLQHYRQHPDQFVYDRQKAAAQQAALERQRFEHSKRQRYEARMMRKAKREGKDLHYYLNLGAALPTPQDMVKFRALPREQVLEAWKEHHSQHCLSFHLDQHPCERGSACAFLHVNVNQFSEQDEVAG